MYIGSTVESSPSQELYERRTITLLSEVPIPDPVEPVVATLVRPARPYEPPPTYVPQRGREGARSRESLFPLKGLVRLADTGGVDAAQRKEILNRYVRHSRRFEAAAARRSSGNANVIPISGPVREAGQNPTMREIEVLQLISDGLANREIGTRLFLSEETVKSHVRHLLAKLQARSRAHAVAVGFRRGLIA